MRYPTRCSTRHIVSLVLLATAFVGAGPRPGHAQALAFEEVVANLKVGDPKVRMEALKLLRESGYLEAGPLVAPLLSDPVPEIQALAIETEVALYLADEAYTKVYGKTLVKARGASLPLLAFAQGRGATIANLPPPAIIRGLIAGTASSVLPTRFEAAYAIGVLGPPLVRRGQFQDARAAVDGLMTLLREPDGTIRLAATHVLGRLVGAALDNPSVNADLLALRADVGDQIIAGMNDPDELIKLSSMGALGEMRYDRAVQSLSDTFSYYKRNELGMAALDALSRIAHPGSMTVFAALLENSDEHVRRLSVEGIGRSGDPNALANLEVRTTREKSKLVRQAVAFARAKGGDFSEIALVVEGLRSVALRPYAHDYLVELGAPLAPSLVGFASHKDVSVRSGVVDVLGIVGNEASLTAVDAFSRDKSKQVAAAAERSRRRLALRLPAQPREP